MSERLSPDDDQEDKKIYSRHKDIATELESAERDMRRRELIEAIEPDYDPRATYSFTTQKVGERHTNEVHLPPKDVLESRYHRVQQGYDMYIAFARDFKDVALDKYIETARQDAEAQGVHIDLEQPKE